MGPSTWTVKCTNEWCHRVWAIGEVFYSVLGHHFAPPPDTIIATGLYKVRHAINRVYCDGCAKIIYEGFSMNGIEEDTEIAETKLVKVGAKGDSRSEHSSGAGGFDSGAGI